MSFVCGVIIGVLLVIGAVTVYSLAQMAGMYENNVERWFDDFD